MSDPVTADRIVPTARKTRAERRALARQKSFMQGRVYYNRRRSSMDCIVREFSDLGARLQFPEVAALPETFEVFVPSKDEYFQARAIWHKGSDVGVCWFSEATLSPTAHSDRSGDPIGDRVTRLEHEVAVLRKLVTAMRE